MSEGLSITIDSRRMVEQMFRYVELLGISAVEVVGTQTRLLLKTVIAFTPPLGRKGMNPETAGKLAVARDVGRAMRPIRVDFYSPRTSDRIKLLVSRRNQIGLQALVRNTKTWKGWSVAPFSPDLHLRVREQIRQRKFRQRIFILGTVHGVSSNVKTGATNLENLGETAAWNKYVKSRQGAVGRLKAAWAVAYQAVGGSVPGWIKRHIDPKGTYTPNFTDPKRPSIEFRNFAVGVGDLVPAFERAMEVRRKAMMSDIARKIKLAGKAAGFQTK